MGQVLCVFKVGQELRVFRVGQVLCVYSHLNQTLSGNHQMEKTFQSKTIQMYNRTVFKLVDKVRQVFFCLLASQLETFQRMEKMFQY